MHPKPMMSGEFATVRLPGLLALRPGRGRPSTTMTTTTPPAVANKKRPAATSARCACACASSRRDDAEEFSCNGGGGGGGRLVDEGMVVLRRRIHEMEAAERGWERLQEWDATYDYDVDGVCQLLGVLRVFLVNSPPGVAVGLVAVLLLAVPASTAFLLVKLLTMLHRRSSPICSTTDDDETDNVHDHFVP